MSILIFIPMSLIAAIIERPRQPKRRSGYRKRTQREFHVGRSY